MTKLIFLSFIVLLLFTCKPEHIESDLEKGIITGMVVDYTTNTGVPNATVFLLGNDGGGTWVGGGTPSFFIDQTTADANGNFTFQIEYNEEIGYLCSAVADLYFDYNDEFSVERYSSGVVNVEVKLNPIGYVNLHVKSVNIYESSDNINIQSGSIDPLYGNIDTSFILSVPGNDFYHIVWFHYVDGINNGSESADIYCPSFDTTYFELLY
ncbi:MAG: carboxypeptidase regulatory-like domain-containing protein [Chitinophagales bacterium]|jgi:hypothetical protein|nr:carboxypeptidase regulatory-like domain-containing protein [Chitinophagales bacterium]MBP9222203.1 carboxypeptidase regulatory-like domain-containing protein [Chitinophagales bacterium]MBP9796393.1 carboxypeptidase regulatory-like domain-containing protein [Chitinophagales bacterium]